MNATTFEIDLVVVRCYGTIHTRNADLSVFGIYDEMHKKSTSKGQHIIHAHTKRTTHFILIFQVYHMRNN